METKKSGRSSVHNISFFIKLFSVLALLFLNVNIVFALPSGQQVVNGNATFNTRGNSLTVTNSPNTIINWQNFSILGNEAVLFSQQSSNSSVLNRIIGQNPSSILGLLQSNGRVFLINPNGIFFGKGAQVNVNGLIASTLGISNQDFLAGKYNFAAGATAGPIQNQGAITTPGGGAVYLISPNIENSGIITSPNGQVLLAAGHSVQLVDSSNPDIAVVVSADADNAVNLGQIISQSGKIGIYGGLISQKGLVSADSATVGENGQIIFKAANDVTLDAGSITSAKGGGTIKVLGGMESGTVTVNGTLDASAPIGGNGGFIETSASKVSTGDDAHITTAAPYGKTGTWLIDPQTYNIDETEASNIGTALAGSNVTIDTTGSTASCTGVSCTGGSATDTAGDINVNYEITKSAGTGTTLSLLAYNNINITQPITCTSSTLNLTLAPGYNGTGIATLSSSQNINLNGGVLDAREYSGDLSLGPGSTVSNATLLAGTLTMPVSSTVNFNNLTLDTNFTVPHGSTLNVNSGSNLTLGSTLTLGDGSGGGTLNFPNMLGSQSLLGTGTVTFGNTVGTSSIVDGSGFTTLTLGSGLSINGAGTGSIYEVYPGGTLNNQATITPTGNLTINGSLGSGFSTINNSGSITAGTSGKSITISAFNLNNTTGSITASNGGTLILNTPTFANTGSVTASSGGILVFEADSSEGWTNNSPGIIQAVSGGIIDLYSGTFNLPFFDSLNAAAGTLTLSGPYSTATIDGGSTGVTITGSNVVLSPLSTVTFDNNLTLDTSFTVPNGSTLKVSNGNLTLGEGSILTLGDQNGPGTLYFISGSTPSLLGSAMVTFGNPSSGVASEIYSSGSLTLGSGLTISGSGNGQISSVGALTNNATITAGSSGSTIIINTPTLTNAGSITASEGGTLQFEADSSEGWSNSGTIQALSGGTINLFSGTFNRTFFDSLNASGGTLYLAGTLDNTTGNPGALAINGNTTGTLTLQDGATINGGTIAAGVNGGNIVLPSNTNVSFNDLTLNRDFTIPGGSELDVYSGNLTLGSGHTLTLGDGSGGGTLYFYNSSDQSLLSSGTSSVIFGNGSDTSYINNYYSTNLTLGSGLTINGSGTGGIYNFGGTITNNATIAPTGNLSIYAGTIHNIGPGSITAGTSGMSTIISASTFTNTGSITASGGGTLQLMADSSEGWSNSGTIQALSGGTINLNSGTYTLPFFDSLHAAAGTLTLSAPDSMATLDITNQTLTAGGTVGTLTLQDGATIDGGLQGGAITGSNIVLPVSTTVNFNNLTLDTNFTVPSGSAINVNSGNLTLGNGRTLTLGDQSGPGSLYFNLGSQSLLSSGTSTVTFAHAGGSTNIIESYYNNDPTFTLGSGLTINGAGKGLILGNYIGAAGILDNLATITPTGNLIISGFSSINNSGTLAFTGSIIMGTGTTNTLINNGTIAPGGVGTVGALSIIGNLTQGDGGQISLDLGGTGANQYDKLVVSGSVSLNGTLNIGYANDYTGNTGDTFANEITSASESLSGLFSNVNPPVGTSLTITYTTTAVSTKIGVTTTVSTTTTTSTVPSTTVSSTVSTTTTSSTVPSTTVSTTVSTTTTSSTIPSTTVSSTISTTTTSLPTSTTTIIPSAKSEEVVVTVQDTNNTTVVTLDSALAAILQLTNPSNTTTYFGSSEGGSTGGNTSTGNAPAKKNYCN